MRKALTVACALALALASLIPLSYGIIAPGQQAPDFTLTDIDGNTFTLSDIYQHHRVLLSFCFTR